jgi:hypothetical protein
MNTISAILDVDADGTIHLPLPEEMRHGKVEVTATLRALGTSSIALRATPEQVSRRRTALRELRALGGLGSLIPDPTLWQRDERTDRTLPGRE